MRIQDQPGFRLSTLLASGLAMSIGWGIRGNFGHEFGAMIPGALAAIVVCLMSGREDWRRRVAYFAFFGALGWGFGGSISYAQVIAYTHSGQYASTLYGYAMLFVIGFLWGGMGGAGTAFPAVADRERMQAVFAPLLWIFGVWWLWAMFGDALITRWMDNGDDRWYRHLDPLYWFDTDWVQAFTALIAVCLYTLCHEPLKRTSPALLSGIVAAFLGFFAQFYFGFHAIWFMPVVAIAGTLIGGVAYRCYDEALVLAGLIAALAVLGGYLGYEWTPTSEHWFAETGVAIAIVLFAIGLKRASVVSLVAGVPLAVLLTWWIARQWAIDYDDWPGALLLALMFALFASLIVLKPGRGHGLAVFAAAGGLVGWIVQRAGGALGIADMFSAGPFPRRLGDVSMFVRAAEGATLTPAQSALVERHNQDTYAFTTELFTNWPSFFSFDGVQPYIGWGIGVVAGASIYFFRYGKFDFGARLYSYMAIGWFISFLIFPVLLGIRMTPPRGDSWAGVLGLLIGTLVFLFRSGLAPVVYAALVTGIVGGIGFSGGVFLKLFMMRIGNPYVGTNPDTIERFRHYQTANWHSFLEQTYGFINGIGIAVAMALLANYVRPARKTGAPRAWTGPFAVGFVLVFLVFVNWRKAVGTWVRDHGAAPESMRLFWLDSVELTSQQWFAIVYWIAGLAVILLLARSARKPLALYPASWLGRGQLLFLAFLWMSAIFNFERAVTGFNENRLITEGVIIVNCAIVTYLLIAHARENDTLIAPRRTYEVPYINTIVTAILVLLATAFVQTQLTHRMYRDLTPGLGLIGNNPQYRFGEDAEWRIDPLLRSEEHR